MLAIERFNSAISCPERVLDSVLFMCRSSSVSLSSFPDPVFYFGNTEYQVDESAGFVEVQVWRTGTDLSKGGAVTERSRKTDPVSAEGTSLINKRL